MVDVTMQDVDQVAENALQGQFSDSAAANLLGFSSRKVARHLFF